MYFCPKDEEKDDQPKQVKVLYYY